VTAALDHQLLACWLKLGAKIANTPADAPACSCSACSTLEGWSATHTTALRTHNENVIRWTRTRLRWASAVWDASHRDYGDRRRNLRFSDGRSALGELLEDAAIGVIDPPPDDLVFYLTSGARA
jgi:hypothetical protein